MDLQEKWVTGPPRPRLPGKLEIWLRFLVVVLLDVAVSRIIARAGWPGPRFAGAIFPLIVPIVVVARWGPFFGFRRAAGLLFLAPVIGMISWVRFLWRLANFDNPYWRPTTFPYSWSFGWVTAALTGAVSTALVLSFPIAALVSPDSSWAYSARGESWETVEQAIRGKSDELRQRTLGGSRVIAVDVLHTVRRGQGTLVVLRSRTLRGASRISGEWIAYDAEKDGWVDPLVANVHPGICRRGDHDPRFDLDLPPVCLVQVDPSAVRVVVRLTEHSTPLPAAAKNGVALVFPPNGLDTLRVERVESFDARGRSLGVENN